MSKRKGGREGKGRKEKRMYRKYLIGYSSMLAIFGHDMIHWQPVIG
jgi:hypothetical protein